MNILYNTGIRTYRLAVRMAASRNVKAAKMLAGQDAVFDLLKEKIDPNARYMWMHASSLGEFEQGRPLIEKVRREQPDMKILLTFFSPSGYEVRKNYSGADIICYLPFDTPENACRFVETVRPELAVFVKYEFWGNYLCSLSRRNIPTYLISAIFRDSQSFFKWWGGMFRKMLRCYTSIFVQDESSRRRLQSIGVTNAVVTGDTRLDRVTEIMSHVSEMPAVEKFVASSPLTIVVGSSWPADEDVYIPWLKAHPEIKVIIAPHEFDADRLTCLRNRLGDGCTVLLSELEHDGTLAASRYLIVDCFGKLASIYRYCDVAYVGGGFGAGIHNINEAAVYGVPVVFGPNNRKFKEASDLIDCGGAFEVKSDYEFAEVMNRVLSDSSYLKKTGDAAGRYIRSSIGATDRVYSLIFKK